MRMFKYTHACIQANPRPGSLGTGSAMLANRKRAPVPAEDVPKPVPVVPITIRVAGSTRCVVITGPNTGGKTAALKALGLSALLAQSGCGVPASAPARLPVFSAVLADIGDSQVRAGAGNVERAM
jgi:DNA mismatch repair protein MutS2